MTVQWTSPQHFLLHVYKNCIYFTINRSFVWNLISSVSINTNSRLAVVPKQLGDLRLSPRCWFYMEILKMNINRKLAAENWAYFIRRTSWRERQRLRNGLGIDSRQGQETSLFSGKSRPTGTHLGSYLMGTSRQGVKQPGSEADHSPPPPRFWE
jgi:hypothetical protein